LKILLHLTVFLSFIFFCNIRLSYGQQTQKNSLSKVEMIFKNYTKQYALNDIQKQKLKSLITQKIQRQKFLEDSLSFNAEWSMHRSELSNLNGHKAFMELLLSFDLNKLIASQHNHKGNLIIKYAQKGFVPKEKTQKLLILLLDLKIEYVSETVSFHQWNNDNIFYVRDNEYNKGTIGKKYRKKIQKLLTCMKN